MGKAIEPKDLPFVRLLVEGLQNLRKEKRWADADASRNELLTKWNVNHIKENEDGSITWEAYVYDYNLPQSYFRVETIGGNNE